jgi:hydrogenase expression/formation protein HypC
MCLAFPGKILKIDKDTALVDFDGIQKEANISLVKIKTGDYVIVHAGFAIQKLTKEDAFAALKMYE